MSPSIHIVLTVSDHLYL
jgi:hypothetical protein